MKHTLTIFLLTLTAALHAQAPIKYGATLDSIGQITVTTLIEPLKQWDK